MQRKFKVQFKGVGQLGVQYAAKFLSRICKDAENKWVPLHVLDPSGNPTRVYFGEDASPKQEKIELLTAVLAKVIKSQLGDINVFARKAEGVVTIDFKPCACIQLADDRSAVLQWNSAVCEAFSLDKESAKTAFFAGRKDNPINWSYS